MATKRKGRRVQPKLVPLTVGEDEYTVRINIPMQTVADLKSGDYDRVISAMRLIVHDHPFLGDDDEPLDVALIPDDEASRFMEAYGRLLNALPPA